MAAIQDTPEETGSSKVDPTVPQTARIWNYWLGGKDNYAVDRNDEAETLTKRIMAAVPSGSYLTVDDGTNVIRSEEHQEAQRIWNESAKPPYKLRTPEQMMRFYDGLELVEPGLVSVPRWRPEPSPSGPPVELDVFGGVARRP